MQGTSDNPTQWVDHLLPWKIARHLSAHGSLIQQFVKRDVLARYRGSFLGPLWSLLRPLSMLALYALVFGYIFQARLGTHPNETKVDFALALFCGLILFDFFAESTSRAPNIVLSNPNYVTKVVFPLEILPVTTIGAALIQLMVSLVPLLVGLLCVHHTIPGTALYLPIIILPLILFCLGLGWFLASLGVFVRDINGLVPLLLQVLMYASAIFYSLDRVPPSIARWLLLNPLALTIHQARNALLWGIGPDWMRYGMMLAFSCVALVIGYTFFMRTKRAFADVM